MHELLRNAQFASEFSRGDRETEFDYISRDGKIGLVIKLGVSGLRDLHAAAILVALQAVEEDFTRACLVVAPQKTTVHRIVQEWRRILNLLRPSIASRLAMIAIGPESTLVEPTDPDLARIADIFDAALNTQSDDRREFVGRVTRTGKLEEITKILLIRWLLNQGPVPIGELARQAGCSVMTALVVVKLMSARRILKRVPNRPIGLDRFPVDNWAELVAKARSANESWRFVDLSGQVRSPESLLKRIAKLNVPALAVGGVVAARHWCPELDLHGTPRLDLVLHTPDATADLGFINKVDPALRLAEPEQDSSPSLVIHPLRRAEPLFEPSRRTDLAFADPVETVLHLENLRLPAQARQVLAHLRPELRVL